MSKPIASSFNESRRHPRAKLSLKVDWGNTPACAHEGEVTSLSVGGCFVRTPRRVTQGKAVFVRVMLAPESESVLEGVLQGRIVYALPGVGFGVEFKALPEEYRQHIEDLVDFYLTEI